MDEPLYLYAVNKNGTAEPYKETVTRETPKTYVIGKYVRATIRKATMETAYTKYFTDKESAEKYYHEIKAYEKRALEARRASYRKEKTADERMRSLGFVPVDSENPRERKYQNGWGMAFKVDFIGVTLEYHNRPIFIDMVYFKTLAKIVEEMGL